MAQTPSQVFIRRMKRLRDRRGWTQERLAQELTAAGFSASRLWVAKLESGARSRGVTLDEAVAIAWVLGVPPAYLWIPLGEDSDFTLTPDGATIEPEAARRWAIGQAPAIDSDRYVRMPGEWKADMRVWRLFDRFEEASTAANAAKSRVVAAESFGDEERRRQATGEYVEAVLALADAAEAIIEEGLIPPALHVRQVEAIRKAGRRYDGPTYDDAEEDTQ